MSRTIVKNNRESGLGRADRGVAVLLTCIGRRVSLLKAFARAAKRLRLDAHFYGTDATELSPAFQICDEGFPVRPITHPGYVNQLLSIVRDRQVRLIVPTIDPDLSVLARHKARFERAGCRVLVSEPDVIDICQDKRRTAEFLQTHRFDVPVTYGIDQALSADRQGRFTWPCFVKPWDGSAGKGAVVAHDREELRFHSERIPNAMCQELIEGDEYTCDVYIDFERRVRCVVPRRRIEVRWGEVSKAQVVKDRHIMSEGARLAEALGAGPGVITLQLFRRTDGRITFIEINPRFGGGVPLSIQAGADFPRWILQELAGKRPRIGFDAFQNGLTMLRYDAEVWFADAEGPVSCATKA